MTIPNQILESKADSVPTRNRSQDVAKVTPPHKSMADVQADESAADVQAVIESSRFLMTDLQSQIQLADTKASLILTASAFLASGATLFLTGGVRLEKMPRVLSLSTQGLSILMVVAIVTAICYAIAVAIPNFNSPHVENANTEQVPDSETNALLKNPFYFGTITKETVKADFSRKFRAQTSEQICEALLHQAHSRAQVAERKFKYVRVSLFALGFAIVFWGLTMFSIGISLRLSS